MLTIEDIQEMYESKCGKYDTLTDELKTVLFDEAVNEALTMNFINYWGERMYILAIDPGNTQSGYAIIEMPEFKLIDFGKIDNDELVEQIKFKLMPFQNDSEIVIEKIASYGMAVGKDVFDTCIWIGRFQQAFDNKEVHFVYRKDEKMTLCNSMKAKDSNIRQALIDRYAKFDFKNGKGGKNKPDVFYGVSKDVWQAIAVGVTWYENNAKENR